MQKYKAILLLLVAAFGLGFVGDQFVQAQTIEISEGISLNSSQVVYVIIVGSVAGVLRAWQGYDKSPNDFDVVIFIRNIRNAVLLAIPIALSSAIMLPELNLFGYVMLFFSVVGATDLFNRGQKPSIPTNATEEEIEKILDASGQ